MQIADLEKALFRAQQQTGIAFTLYVGGLASGRTSAIALHRSLPDPANSVLVAVDPGERRTEIVVAAGLSDRLDDQSCRLASLSMTSRFSAGDIAAGLRDGINILADHARTPKVLHTEEPE